MTNLAVAGLNFIPRLECDALPLAQISIVPLIVNVLCLDLQIKIGEIFDFHMYFGHQ